MTLKEKIITLYSTISGSLTGKADVSSLTAYLPVTGGTVSGSLYTTGSISASFPISVGARDYGTNSISSGSNHLDFPNKTGTFAVTDDIVQSDWNQTATGSKAYIKNKPTIPAAQVQTDWNATTGMGVLLNKPTIPAAQVNSDWNATSGVAQILNKPSIPTVGTLNTTASTTQSTNASESFSGSVTLHKVSKTGSYNDLLNKPTIPAAQVQTDWNATTGMGVLLNKPTIPTVPDISTNISSDASSDVKTASPKAVKTYVEGQGYLTSGNLPVAASGTLGAVKVGTGLDIDQNGVLSVTDDESFFRYKITTPETTTSTTSATNDTISVTLKNSAVNAVSADSGTDYIIMTFPDKKQGYARDFFVRLVLTGTDVPTISCCEPSGGGAVEFDVDDDSWKDIDLGVNLLMFTETAQA